MVKKHMKKCSTSLIMREMQIKTTMRCHHITVRRSIIKKCTNNKFWRRCAGKGTLQHYWWGSKFSSVTKSCLTLCDPMDSSMPGCPVHHQLLELAQTIINIFREFICIISGILIGMYISIVCIFCSHKFGKRK